MYDPKAKILADKYVKHPLACKTDIVCWIADDLKVSVSTVYLWLQKGKFKIEKNEQRK